MGEAKETVKGTPSPKKGKKAEKNLLSRIGSIMDDVSNVIQIKQNDTVTEGESAKGENIRKAAVMGAVYTLLSAAKRLMEDY